MSYIEKIDKNRIPQHIAIIMDGNGRWAKQRGKERTYGHQAGAETVHKIIEDAARLGVKYLTLYTFSTENWNRPQEEVAALMNLYRKAYYMFAVILAVLGLMITPFVHLFMKNESYSIGYVRVLYLLWLFRTGLPVLDIVSVIVFRNTTDLLCIGIRLGLQRYFSLSPTIYSLLPGGKKLFLSEIPVGSTDRSSVVRILLYLW